MIDMEKVKRRRLGLWKNEFLGGDRWENAYWGGYSWFSYTLAGGIAAILIEVLPSLNIIQALLGTLVLVLAVETINYGVVGVVNCIKKRLYWGKDYKIKEKMWEMEHLVGAQIDEVSKIRNDIFANDYKKDFSASARKIKELSDTIEIIYKEIRLAECEEKFKKNIEDLRAKANILYYYDLSDGKSIEKLEDILKDFIESSKAFRDELKYYESNKSSIKDLLRETVQNDLEPKKNEVERVELQSNIDENSVDLNHKIDNTKIPIPTENNKQQLSFEL